MTSLVYNYKFIEDLLYVNKDKFVTNDFIDKFKKIRSQNNFNPSRFVKKFNYTNWRNAISKEDEANKNIDDINNEKISLLLNKISGKKFDILSDKLIEIISDNEKYLIFTITKLFNLATEQHLLTPIYSNMCLKLNSKYNKIKQTILEKCKEHYKAHNIIKEDEYQSKYQKYNNLCKKNKDKLKLIGIFHLVGELYKQKLVEHLVIEKYYNLLFVNLECSDKELREQYIECLKEFSIKVGKQYKSENKENFTTILNKIKTYNESDTFNFTNREKFMFMDVIDLFQ